MAALKNYTTTVSVSQTVSDIHKALADHGARKVMFDYDDNGRVLQSASPSSHRMESEQFGSLVTLSVYAWFCSARKLTRRGGTVPKLTPLQNRQSVWPGGSSRTG